MASTPTGTIFSVATAFAAAQTTTIVTNATEAVVTCVGHGYADGDLVEITSGWGRLTKRVFEIDSVTTDTFVLLRANTTSTTRYPAGTGVGTVRKVSTFVQLVKTMAPGVSGGEPKNVTFKFLDSDTEFSINDGFSATTMTLDLDDDDTTAGYEALSDLTEAQTDSVLKLLLPNGSRVYLPGRAALNDMPTLADGQINKMRLTFNGNGRHTRYSAA